MKKKMNNPWRASDKFKPPIGVAVLVKNGEDDPVVALVVGRFESLHNSDTTYFASDVKWMLIPEDK